MAIFLTAWATWKRKETREEMKKEYFLKKMERRRVQGRVDGRIDEETVEILRKAEKKTKFY